MYENIILCRSWEQECLSNNPISCFTMWSNVRKLAGVKQKFTFQPLIHQNQVYESPPEISELLPMPKYQQIPTMIPLPSIISSVKVPLQTSPHIPLLTQTLTEQEVKKTISNCSESSAPGFDKICPLMLHNLHTNAITHFTSLLNHILLSASFPSTWKMVVIIPLLKPLKDTTLPIILFPFSVH